MLLASLKSSSARVVMASSAHTSSSLNFWKYALSIRLLFAASSGRLILNASLLRDELKPDVTNVRFPMLCSKRDLASRVAPHFERYWRFADSSRDEQQNEEEEHREPAVIREPDEDE